MREKSIGCECPRLCCTNGMVFPVSQGTYKSQQLCKHRQIYFFKELSYLSSLQDFTLGNY